MQFKHPGLYSIYFTAFDKADNYKTSRKLVLYDNISHVSFLPTKVTRIETASAATNYTWVNEDTNIVLAIWTERFQNARHELNRWLAAVSPSTNIEDVYDDHYGKRTIHEVPNVYGLLPVTKSLHLIKRSPLYLSLTVNEYHANML